MLLSNLLREAYRPLRLISASKQCLRHHEAAIGRLSAVLGRDATLADLSDDNLARVMSRVIADGRSPGTANCLMSKLRALWEFAARRGLVEHFPTIRKIQGYRRVPVAWTKEQLAALFRAIRTTPGRIEGLRASDWWMALHCILWDTGLRIGSAMRLEWSDVDFTTGTLLVRAETQKQKADQRFKLHPDTLAVLTLIRRPAGKMFPWDRGYSTLWHHYGQLLRRAGLPHGRRDKFHRMRRSVASWFEACGGDATALLGHSSRGVTLAYLDETITGQPQACDRLFRPWRPAG